MNTLKSLLLICLIGSSINGMSQVQRASTKQPTKGNTLQLEKSPSLSQKKGTAPSSEFEMKILECKELPKPEMKDGMPLMEALHNRKTVREFSDKQFDEQLLSNLLWAAFGINREDGRRTAPSAMNRQEIDIYVVTKEGFYYWHPQKNALMKLGKEDISKLTGSQDFVPTAGMNLVMVYNKTRVKEATERQLNFAFCDAGYISQNIYLFCASEGLNTVARGGGFDETLPKYLQLSDKQEIILLQTIGFPKEKESIKMTK